MELLRDVTYPPIRFFDDIQEEVTTPRVDQNDEYILEYETESYETIDVRHILTLVSLGLACLAFVVWAFVWIRNRRREAFRYAFLMFIFAACAGFALSPHSYIWYCLTNQIVLFGITGYVALTTIRALKQNVPAALALVVLVLCVVPPSGLALLRWRLVQAPYNSGEHNFTLDLFTLCIPNLLMLVLALGLASLLTYWVFALDNSRYKEHREYKVIRYNSVCVFIAIVYCLALEIIVTVLLCTPTEVLMLYQNHVINYFMAVDTRGIVLSFLLCFIDLEVWASCPCGFVTLTEDKEVDSDTKPLADAGVAPANEEAGKTHVTSFETEITPRLTVQPKPYYGAVKEQ